VTKGPIPSVNEAAFGQLDEARLVDALRASGKVVLSLVAEQAGRVFGHILYAMMLNAKALRVSR
jgi:putative acetyltransferase